MNVIENATPNQIATEVAEKYLQGKSYDYVKSVSEYLVKIAEITCKLPILTEVSYKTV